MTTTSRTLAAVAALSASALAASLLYGAVAPAALAVDDGAREGSALSRAAARAADGLIAGVETAGPIATVASADGELWPTMPKGVAVMPRATVLNGDYPLVYIAAAKGVDNLDVRVRELSSARPDTAVVFDGSARNGWVTIAKSLKPGAEYAVDVRKGSGEWELAGTFNVSTSGDAGPVTSVGGLSVSEVTGRTSWSWRSQTLPGPAGGVGIELGWESGRTASAGLPDGWLLMASAGSPWVGLEESPVDAAAVDVPAAPAAERRAARVIVDFAYPTQEARLVDRFIIEGKSAGGAWRVLARPGRAFAAADVDVVLGGNKALKVSHVRVGAVVEGTTIWGPQTKVRAQAPPVTGAPQERNLVGAAPGSLVTPGDKPSVVRLVGWNGQRLTFVRNPLGVYEQTGGETPGFVNGLTWIADGEWEFAALDGVVTRFVDGRAVSVESKGAPVASMDWSADGRLTGLTNEIGRSLKLHYAGDAECPQWPGFASIPDRMLCAVTYPGDRTTEIGYVDAGDSAQISLIKDPGNSGETLGWDDRGRLVATRSTLVNRAATVDASLKSLLDTVSYDRDGRAATLTAAPAEVGGATMTKTIDFPTVTEAGLRAWVDSGAEADAARLTVRATGGGYDLSREKLLDPTTWQSLRVTAPYGLDTSVNRNARSGQLQSAVDAVGRRTTYTYDELGQVVTTAGPVNSGAAGPEYTTNYDTERVDGRDKALSGLRAQVYTGDGYRGAVTAEFWEADYTRGALSYAWSGRGSTFSAQASGVWTPTDADDATAARDGWDFIVQASGGADVSLLVGGVVCGRSTNVCHVDGLPKGPKAVTVQVADAPSDGWFSISVAPAGERPESMDYRDLRPGFGLTTVSTSNDDLPGGTDVTRTEYSFDDPSSAQLSSVKTLGGLVTDLGYESSATGDGAWGRLLTRETPGGLVQKTTYWPDMGTVALPQLCGGQTVEVSGQTRTVTRQDGTSVTSYYDIYGLPRAVVSEGGSQIHTLCSTYRADGSVLTSTSYINGEVLESAVFEQAVGGDPRVARRTIAHGSASPTGAGASVAVSDTVDLLGRLVVSEGLGGEVTQTTYDVAGNSTRVLVTPPSGAGAPAQRFDYAYDPQSNLLMSVSVNGVVAAEVTRDPSTGRIASIDYGDAATVGWDYDPSGHLAALTATTANPAYSRIVDEYSRTSVGRIIARSTQVTGTEAARIDVGYEYDSAGRLKAATYSGDVDATFAYEHDAKQGASCDSTYAGAGLDGQRTGGSRSGVAYVSCFDAVGRQTSTTDPMIAGVGGLAEISHDDFGRVTSISGPRALAAQWSAGTLLTRLDEIAADGTGLISTRWDAFGGQVVNKTLVTDAGSSTVRYAGAFVLEVEDDAVVGTGALRFSLPGGASVMTAPGSRATLTIPGVDGSALVRIDMPALATGSADAPGAAAGVVAASGPYGEPLSSPSIDGPSALPNLAWKAASGRETVPGSAAIVMMGDRPYHPALGAFLAADPLVDSGDNLYAYTNGDPINSHDTSGQEDNAAIIGAGIATGVFLLGTFGSGYLMGKFAAQGRNFLAGKARVFGYAGVALSAAAAGTTTYLAVKGQSSDVGIAAGAAVGAAAVAMVGGGLLAKWSYSRTTRLIEARLARQAVVDDAKFEAIDVLAKGVANGKIHPSVATAAGRLVQGLPATTRAEVRAGFKEITLHARATSKALFRAEKEAAAAAKHADPAAFWGKGIDVIDEVEEVASQL